MVCGYLRKFSPWNLEAWHPLAHQKRAIREKSSPSKVSRHTVYLADSSNNYGKYIQLSPWLPTLVAVALLPAEVRQLTVHLGQEGHSRLESHPQSLEREGGGRGGREF